MRGKKTRKLREQQDFMFEIMNFLVISKGKMYLDMLSLSILKGRLAKKFLNMSNKGFYADKSLFL